MTGSNGDRALLVELDIAMIEIESTAGHYGWHLVERQIDLVETVSRTVSDQPSDALSHQTLVV